MSEVRAASTALSRYLSGTQLGPMRWRHAAYAANAYRRAASTTADRYRPEAIIGAGVWQPDRDVADVHRALLKLARQPEVVDVVVFGSHARDSTTGFSDIDALIVLSGPAAGFAGTLLRLRPHVLAAQRAVLAYQPMQHHGFEVASERLLLRAAETLLMPPSALSETKSLLGREIGLTFGTFPDPVARLELLVRTLLRLAAWPAHPWQVHRFLAMFELLPAFYLQARGSMTPKWQSFAAARGEFRDLWWPYDVLLEVRNRWPREERPLLDSASRAVRNPWAANAVWRRAPVRLHPDIRELLDQRLLCGLQELAGVMGRHTA